MSCKMNPEEANTFLRQAFEGQSVRTEIVEMVEGRAVVRLRADKTNLRPGGYISVPTQMSPVDPASYFAVEVEWQDEFARFINKPGIRVPAYINENGD